MTFCGVPVGGRDVRPRWHCVWQKTKSFYAIFLLFHFNFLLPDHASDLRAKSVGAGDICATTFRVRTPLWCVRPRIDGWRVMDDRHDRIRRRRSSSLSTDCMPGCRPPVVYVSISRGSRLKAFRMYGIQLTLTDVLWTRTRRLKVALTQSLHTGRILRGRNLRQKS